MGKHTENKNDSRLVPDFNISFQHLDTSLCHYIMSLNVINTTKQVDCTPEVTPFTIQKVTFITMNGQFITILSSVNWPCHFWDTAISKLNLKHPRTVQCMCSKLFKRLTLKFKANVMVEVKAGCHLWDLELNRHGLFHCNQAILTGIQQIHI